MKKSYIKNYEKYKKMCTYTHTNMQVKQKTQSKRVLKTRINNF